MAEINNFVIDHVIRGIMLDKEGNYLWSINQITSPSLSVSSESSEKADALGTPIAVFNRGKTAEFSAENALFDLGLFAAQNGRKKETAGELTSIVCPAFETYTFDGVNSSVNLEHMPINEPNKIFLLNGDGTLGKSYSKGDTPSSTEFSYSSGVISLPTSLSKDDEIFVVYDYNCFSGARVTGTAVDFPKNGRFMMEVLGADVCDIETQIHAFIDFPKARLDSEVEIGFETESTHPFKIICQQDYCDKKKTLYSIIIPNEE